MSHSSIDPLAAPRTLILIKHALPALVADVAPRHWLLGPPGELQAHRLAQKLAGHQPFELLSSEEPKAARTAALIGADLGVAPRARAGLEELDRPAQPLLSVEEHAALNARLFAAPDRAVLGRESAASALERFSHAISAAVAEVPTDRHVVIVTHGTVISLFVAAHNAVDAYGLWRRLRCASWVALRLPRFEWMEVVDSD
jgi:broad specificity phosphatase PhoE